MEYGIRLTAKLMEVMPDGLQRGAPTVAGFVNAHLDGFASVEPEDDGEWSEGDEVGDAKGANGPSPAGAGERVREEGLCSEGGREGGDDEGGGGESEGQGTIPQTEGVGDEDVEDQVDGVVAGKKSDEN